jgi:hypothetical protein
MITISKTKQGRRKPCTQGVACTGETFMPRYLKPTNVEILTLHTQSLLPGDLILGRHFTNKRLIQYICTGQQGAYWVATAGGAIATFLCCRLIPPMPFCALSTTSPRALRLPEPMRL